MFCKHCGQQLTVDDKFCEKCGTPIELHVPFANGHDQYSNNVNSQYSQNNQYSQNDQYYNGYAQQSYSVQKNGCYAGTGVCGILNKVFSSGAYVISCILMTLAVLMNMIEFDDLQLEFRKILGAALELEDSGATAIISSILPTIFCVAMWCLFGAAYNRNISRNTMSIKVIDVVQKLHWGSLWGAASMVVILVMVFASGSEGFNGELINVLLIVIVLLLPPVVNVTYVNFLVITVKLFEKDLVRNTSEAGVLYLIYIVILVLALALLALAVIWVFVNRGVASVKHSLADGNASFDSSFSTFIVFLIMGSMHILAMILWSTTEGTPELSSLELISQLCYGGAMIMLGVTFLQLKNTQQQNRNEQYYIV